MGQIHGRIHIDGKAQPFVNLPRRYIIQLVEAFHLIAENFHLSLPELQDIFKVSIRDAFRQTDDEFRQMTQVFFNLFVPNSSNMVDSFELLSVLIVSSDMTIKEKIEKIIDLVDFEKTTMFTIHEVALAMRSTVAGMCKVTELDLPRNDLVDSLSSLVFSVVSENVSVEYNQNLSKKITLDQLLLSATTLPEIRRWLDHFDDLDEKDVPKSSGLPDLDHTKHLFDKECFEDSHPTSACWEEMIQLCAIEEEKEDSLPTICDSVPQVGIELDWVYGRNTRNVTSSNAFYTSSGAIAYAAGVVGIVFEFNDTGSPTQRYYMGHTNYISCIAVSVKPDGRNGSLVATAEMSLKPEIHIWSSKTLTMLQCMKGFHSVGVQCIDFSPSQKLLLTMGMDTMHSIAIYNWKLNQIVFTTQTSEIVLHCRFLHSDHKFGVCGNSFFSLWDEEDSIKSFFYVRKHCLFGKRFQNQAMKCLATWKDKIISGGRDGRIYMWEGRSCVSVLEAPRNKAPISALNVTEMFRVYAGTTDGLLLIYNEKLELVVTYRINAFIKGSCCIDSLSCSGRDTILVGTTSGELLVLNETDGSLLKFVTISNCAKGSFGLDTSPRHCEEVVTIGNDGEVRVLNNVDKTIAREANFGASVTVMSYNNEGNRIVVGLDEPNAGQLLVLDSLDLSIVVKSRPCNKILMDCKHSRDGKYMAVGSANHNIYIFDANNYSVVARATGHTAPVHHIDFGCSKECGTTISIRSNSLNKEIMFWKLDGKQISPISQRKTVFESNSCPISWDTRTLHQLIDVDNIESCEISEGKSIAVITDSSGEMRIFNYPPNKEQCALVVQGHGRNIGNLQFSKDHKRLFTLGKYDNCLMRWEIRNQQRNEMINSPQHHVLNHVSNRRLLTSVDATETSMSLKGNRVGDGKYSEQWRKNIVEPSTYDSNIYPSTPQSFTLDWVQGYNGSFRNNLEYSYNDVLIYPVGKILIFHDMVRNKQSYYKEARELITSLAIHPSRKISAVGNGMKESEILCIDNESLGTIRALRGHENAPILVMKFNKNGHLLATINADEFQTLSIYDWKLKSCAIKHIQTTKQPTYDIAFGIDDILQAGNNFVRFWHIEIGSIHFSDVSIQNDKMLPVQSMLSFEAAFVVGGNDGSLYKICNSEIVSSVQLCESESAITALNSSEKLIVCCSKDGVIGVFDSCFSLMSKFSVKDVGVNCDDLVGSIACHKDHRFSIGTETNQIFEFSIDCEGKILRIGSVEGHSGETLTGLAISPDSRICATTSDDKFLRIWKVDGIKLIKSVQLHTISKSCCFSPDGLKIAVGYGSPKKIFASESPGKWEIFDLSTFESLLEDRPTRKMITEIKWSDSFVVIGSSDCKLYIYSINSENVQADCLHVIEQHYSPIQNVDFSKDSKYLKVNCAYNLHFFSIEDGKYIEDASLMRDVEWRTHNCIFSWDIMGVWSECNDNFKIGCVDAYPSNNEEYILVGFSHGDLGVFHYPCITGQSVSRFLHGHHGRVGRVQWINEKQFVSTGLDDKSLMKWKLSAQDIGGQTKAPTKTFEPPARNYEINNTAQRWEVERFKRPWVSNMVPPSSDSKSEKRMSKEFQVLDISSFQGKCLSCLDHNEAMSVESSICLVHNSLNNRQRYFRGHRNKISCVAISTTRRHLIASGEAGQCPKIKLWDVNSCNEICSLENGHYAEIQFLAFSDCDQMLVSIDRGLQHSVCIWNSISGEWFDGRLQIKVQSGISIPSFLATLPEAFAIGLTTEIVCWNYYDGQTLVPMNRLQMDDEDTESISCGIRFDKGIASGTTSGFLCLWDVGNGLKSKVKAHECSLTCLQEHHDILISGAKDGTVTIWNTELEKKLSFDLKTHPRFNGHGLQSLSTCVNEECNSILVGSSGNGIFKISTRTSNIECLREAHCKISDFIFHPYDDRIYATCDANGMIRIWSIADGLPVTQRLETNSICNSIDWSHDGEEILVGCVVENSASSSSQTSCFLIDCESMSIKWTSKDCNETITLAKFSGQSEMFALASVKHKIYVYDHKGRGDGSLKPRLKVLSTIHKARIRSIDFSDDCYYIQTSSDDYEHIRFNTDDGEVMTLPSQLKNIKWSTYTCHFGWSVHGIWPPVAEITETSPETTYVHCSKDEKLLAVGLSNGEIRIYPYPCTTTTKTSEKNEYYSQKIHIGPVSKCIFNSNSSLMISLSEGENHLVIWKILE